MYLSKVIAITFFTILAYHLNLWNHLLQLAPKKRLRNPPLPGLLLVEELHLLTSFEEQRCFCLSAKAHDYITY